MSYNHHPLYRYSSDAAPGDVNGQGCYGIWYVLTPAGTALHKRGPQC